MTIPSSEALNEGQKGDQPVPHSQDAWHFDVIPHYLNLGSIKDH